MPTTKSAEKALRQSKRKRAHNLFWKRRIKSVMNSLEDILATDEKNTDILKEHESALQKVLDKAAKNNVIHKNKAGRLKSRFAKKISAHEQKHGTKSKSKSS